MRIKTYSEMIQLGSYQERLEYLKLLDGNVKSPRHISEEFYKSDMWKYTRGLVLGRDIGFDLGIFGLYINGPIYVHHIDPITEEDIVNLTPKLTSTDNLICTSLETHNAIHYKSKAEEYVERKPGDTILW